MNFLRKLFKTPAFIIGALFFIAGIATLSHYGINWDTINHLPRGQAYLHYFLTGNKDYSDLPQFSWYQQKEDTLFFKPDVPKKDVPRVSLYQSAGVNFNYFVKKDGGHPPLSDTLSSLFNYVFFQKLGIINDIDSYRIYGVLLAAILVGVIYAWVGGVYGKLSGIITALSLALYPLFWSESHFNGEKDIPETVFWSLTLYATWRGVKEKNWKWVLASGAFFGLALGTKFNILFIPFVIIPWLVIAAPKILKHKWFWLSGLTAVIIGFAIFVGSWPFLWADPIGRIVKVFGFYQGIGLSESFDARFIGPFGINLYPLLGILYTTPILILVFGALGISGLARRLSKDKKDLLLLVLFWLLVPIGRVVWPGTSIYGGLRQIMEYIPAMAILAGIGAESIAQSLKLKTQSLKNLLLFVAGTLLLVPIIRIHPNENVYFNSLIGGLSGAKEKDFPFWGNTFGAAYRQGVSWINKNAEKGANVVLAYELLPNVPGIWVRRDIVLQNGRRSGYLRRGEYVITLPFRGTAQRSYFDMYVRTFLVPVYEVKVDGAPVVTVWKNDEKHLRFPLKEESSSDIKLARKEDALVFDLGSVKKVSRLEVSYDQSACQELSSGTVRVSPDGGEWQELPGVLPRDWLIPLLGQQPKEGNFIYPFVGQETRYIEITFSPKDACLGRVQSSKIFYFTDTGPNFQ